MNRTIWDKNIAALDERYSYLKEALLQDRLESADRERQLTVGTEEVAGRKILFVQQENRVYQLDTLYDEDYLTNYWYEILGEMRYANKTTMFGFGNGMFARKYLQTADDSAQLLVYEPSVLIFRKVMEEFDLSDLLLSDRLFVLVEGYANVDFSLQMKQFVNYTDIETFHYELYMNYDKLFNEESKAVHNEVQLVVNAITGTQYVMARHGEYYYANTLTGVNNLLHSKSLFALHERLPKDVPVFIVAAGPSLDKNIEELKKIGEKGIVFAVDTALPALLKYDIIPHLFASVDGKKNKHHFKNERVVDIPLLCEPTSVTELLEGHRGPEFVLNNYNKHIFAFFQENHMEWPVLESGGSVANTVFELAIAFGYRHIILVGQDLAYTNDRTHSSDTIKGARRVKDEVQQNLTVIEGYDGDEVTSSQEFKLYRRWFEGRIRECPDVCVINSTEGGARIQGSVQMPLKKAIEQYCIKEYPIKEAFEAVPDLFDDTMKQKFIAYLQRTPQDLREARQIAKAAIRDYDKMGELAHRGKLGSELKSSYRGVKEKIEKLQSIPAMEYIYNRNQHNVYESLRDLNQSFDNAADEIIYMSDTGKKELEMIVHYIELTIPEMEQKFAELK